MNIALSDYWVVEYSFFADSFSVVTLNDSLTNTQEAFHSAQLCTHVILAIHPMRVGADDECDVWKERRNKCPLTPGQRLKELRPYIKGIEDYLPKG